GVVDCSTGRHCAQYACRSPGQKRKGAEGGEEEVARTEDLRREHGLLKRILLIYDEVDVRIAQQKEFPPDAVSNSAKIIRSFIEQYHEKLEEDYLFPRFRKHNLLVDLVNVLQQQHEAGRRVTEQILALSGSVSNRVVINRRSQQT